jgi:hypothetical protein
LEKSVGWAYNPKTVEYKIKNNIRIDFIVCFFIGLNDLRVQ